MHRAAVIADDEMSRRKGGYEISKRCFPGAVIRLGQVLGDFVGYRDISRSAQLNDLGVIFFRKMFGDGDKVFGGPALGGAIFGAGTESENQAIMV